MLLHCSNKKCNTTTDHKLRQDTGDVYCMTCGEINRGITDFSKAAMKSQGDYYRSASKRAFMYGCKKCNDNRAVNIVRGKAFCKICGTEVYVPPTSIEAIKASAAFADEDDSAVKEEPVKPVELPKRSYGAMPPRVAVETEDTASGEEEEATKEQKHKKPHKNEKLDT